MGGGGSKTMPPDIDCWGFLTHSTGKLFCVLSKTHFMAFKNRNAFVKNQHAPLDHAICALPLYDLVATADAEGLDSQTIFLIRTSERLIKFRAGKADEQLAWLTGIAKAVKNAELIVQRRKIWKEDHKWTLHCYVVEASEIEDVSTGTVVSAYIDKAEEKSAHDSYLQSYDVEKIVQFTRTAETSNPVFGDIISFPAVSTADTVVFTVQKSNKKNVGTVRIKMNDIDLKGPNSFPVLSPRASFIYEDIEEQFNPPQSVENEDMTNTEKNFAPIKKELATGLHQWIDIIDGKGVRRGKLHLVIRAEPAEKLDDLTMNSTQFKDARNMLLGPHVHYSDDHKMTRKLRIYIGTWNVGNAEPSPDLSDWIQTKTQYDIMAIGCQECKYDPRKGYSSCEKDWEDTISTALGPDYELLEKRQMWQIALLIFARKNIVPEIRDVDSNKEATGIGRVMGNKGGVTINFKFRHTSFCFVNSHLAAHQDKVENRNFDVAEITNEMKCGSADLVNNWNYVFWMGDLNYRIEWGEGDDEKKARKPTQQIFDEVCQLIHQCRFDELCAQDQLKNEMKSWRVFGNFSEEKVFKFEPTFKVERGKELAYKNQRTPAYCDRILWKNQAGSKIELNKFTSALKVLSSDHKPVWADFTARASYYTIAHDFSYDSCVCKFSDFQAVPLSSEESKVNSKLQKAIYQVTCPILAAGAAVLDPANFEKGFSQEFEVRFTNLDRLKQYFLIVEMRTSDAVVGYGTVCLSKIYFNPSTEYFQPYPFNILITHGTQGQVRLKGTIAFRWIKDVRRKYTKLRFSF